MIVKLESTGEQAILEQDEQTVSVKGTNFIFIHNLSSKRNTYRSKATTIQEALKVKEELENKYGT